MKKDEHKLQKSKVDSIPARLNRIEGQVRAIKKMYEKEKGCNDIIQQVQAARAALAKVASLMLTSEAKKCAEEGRVSEFEKVVERTFKTM